MTRFRRYLAPMPALVLGLALVGFTVTGCDKDETSGPGAVQPTPTPIPTATPTPTPGLNPKEIAWLDADVSDWAETSRMRVVFTDDGQICLDHSKVNEWPAVEGVYANMWVIAQFDGTWYGATFEWLRPGDQCKPLYTVEGGHIKQPVFAGWRAQSGVTYGFMISGLARLGWRSVEERSNIVLATWP